MKNPNNEIATSNNTVIFTDSEVVCQRNSCAILQFIEYDYWIDERTMAFCLFPKESRNKPYKSSVVHMSQTKPITYAFVPKPNLEPKNFTTH